MLRLQEKLKKIRDGQYKPGDFILADAKDGPNGPEATHFREAFRTRGPSNYAHGKQVEL